MTTARELDQLEERGNGQAHEIASLPPHLAIIKMENDSIQSLAAAHPRDFAAIKRDLSELLKAFPVLATEAIYNKPVGREHDTCGECGKEVFRKKGVMAKSCFSCRSTDIREGAMKYARNLSVRAAETLSEAYGFNRVRSDATIIDEDTVKVEATFTDFQRGRIWQDATVVSRVQTRRDGTTDRLSDDRFFNVILKAEKSKSVREVINRSINAGLKAWFWEECEKITDGLLDEKTLEKIIGQFSTKGVAVDKLEWLLSKPKILWTQDDRKTLLGVWNAIKDGETTIAEAFDLETPRTEQPGSRAHESPLNEELESKKEAVDPPGLEVGDDEINRLASLAVSLGCPEDLAQDQAAWAAAQKNPDAMINAKPWQPKQSRAAKPAEQRQFGD
jgi:hypothetical protein